MEISQKIKNLPEFSNVFTGDWVPVKKSRKLLYCEGRPIGRCYRRAYLQLPQQRSSSEIAMNFAVHLFEECPLPSGFFGQDISLHQLLEESESEDSEKISERCFVCLEWYDPSLLENGVSELFGSIWPGLTDWMETACEELLGDVDLLNAIEIYNECISSSKIPEIDFVAKKLSESNFGLVDYQKRLARQICFKLQDHATWNEV